MSLVEKTVILKLENYKEKANRDRFILPKNNNISTFTKIIEESIVFFNK